MKTILSTTAAVFAATQAFAFARAECSDPLYAAANPADCSNAVPEISALEGTAALAVLAAIVLIAWERRRRAA